jgi:hypothetical protein
MEEKNPVFYYEATSPSGQYLHATLQNARVDRNRFYNGCAHQGIS